MNARDLDRLLDLLAKFSEACDDGAVRDRIGLIRSYIKDVADDADEARRQRTVRRGSL